MYSLILLWVRYSGNYNETSLFSFTDLSIHFINAQPLSQRLDALLHEEVLKTSEVGIAVFDLTTGKSVYRYQDDKLYGLLLLRK